MTIDPNGFAATAPYDVRGWLTGQTAPSGGGTTAYAYDLASRLTSLTDPVGNVTSWTRDAVGRAATEVDPLGKITTFAHDLVGSPTRRKPGVSSEGNPVSVQETRCHRKPGRQFRNPVSVHASPLQGRPRGVAVDLAQTEPGEN